jgi:hypothetical protein
VISTDASTPRNPKKPRLSRRLLSHFTLTLSVLLALSFVALAVVGPSTQKVEAGAANWRDQVNWLDPWTYSFADEIYDYLMGSRDGGLTTGDPTQYALVLATALKNSLTATENQVKDFKNHQDLLSFYYIWKAEWAARQLWLEQNSTNKVFQFDPIRVLQDSQICPDMMAYVDFSIEQFNQIANSVSGVGTNFTGIYSTVNCGIYGTRPTGDGKWSSLSTPSSPTLNISLMLQIDYSHIVYWDGISDLYVKSDMDYNYNLQLKDKTGSSVVFQKAITKTPYTIQLVKIPATEINLTDGLYTFPPGVIGKILPIVTWASKPFISIKDTTWLESVNGLLNVRYAGGAENIYGDYTCIGAYTSEDQRNSADFHYKIKPYAGATIALMDKLGSTLTNTLQFAQSYYNAIVASGDPGGAWDLPLMLMPDPSQMEGMDWQQIYALYIAYLQQANEWYQEHSGALDASRVNISAESLNLKVRGSIVNETGVTLYDNTTVWTPFITNEEMVLELGPNVVGFAMYGIKWGNSDSLQNFTMSVDSTLIGINPGYTLYIQEMIYQNEMVETVTLTPTTVQVTITNIISPPGPPNIEQITDLDWIIDHWYYIAIIGGVICLLGAIATRNMPIMAAGLVLLAAGGIGWYLAGDTSLIDWLSMEPRNLTMWLQNLR